MSDRHVGPAPQAAGVAGREGEVPRIEFRGSDRLGLEVDPGRGFASGPVGREAESPAGHALFGHGAGDLPAAGGQPAVDVSEPGRKIAMREKNAALPPAALPLRAPSAYVAMTLGGIGRWRNFWRCC
jgi:hypothetical protein